MDLDLPLMDALRLIAPPLDLDQQQDALRRQATTVVLEEASTLIYSIFSSARARHWRDDACQDLMNGLIRGGPRSDLRFENPYAARAWLRFVITNLLRDRIRHHKVRSRHLQSLFAEAEVENARGRFGVYQPRVSDTDLELLESVICDLRLEAWTAAQRLRRDARQGFLDCFEQRVESSLSGQRRSHEREDCRSRNRRDKAQSRMRIHLGGHLERQGSILRERNILSGFSVC